MSDIDKVKVITKVVLAYIIYNTDT